MNRQHEQQTREVRRRIARLRRRIDRQALAVADRAGHAMAWKTYWHRHPLPMLLGAVAIGLTASRLFGNDRLRHLFAERLRGAANIFGGMPWWEQFLTEWAADAATSGNGNGNGNGSGSVNGHDSAGD